MSRTSWVAAAIIRSRNNDGATACENARTLAAEVERLEKRENELINALDMGQINCDAVYDELREEREDAKQRAETAEARVAELEAQLEDAECCVTKYARAGERAKARIAELEELHSMQLAAISTATIQNTVKSTADRIPPDNPYSTVAYADVCRAVDREMRERQRAETAEARVKELEERLKGTLQAGGYQYFYEQLHAAEREAGNARYVAEQAQKKVAELEAQNARLRAALSVFALLESDDDGPYILVRNPRPGEIARARELMIALNGEEASK